MSRNNDLMNFIQQIGWGAAKIAPLAGDASNRRYHRLHHPDGRVAVLMDAPPDKGENIAPFVDIATYLTGTGLSAPEIFAANTERGFLLIEDLGDDLFARLILVEPALELPLYQCAVDVLSHLHRQAMPELEPYDARVMTPLATRAFDWYQFGAEGAVDLSARSRFLRDFHALLAPLDTQPKVLIQRDYHAENLLWIPERDGVARVGLLDFQDAMAGHPAYDLVSMLQDARRDVPRAVEQAMIDRFLEQNPQDAIQFKTAYALLGAQRNLRILGGFSRLCLKAGKAQYIDLIPRVWAHIQTNLQHPVLRGIADLIRETLPPPSQTVLDELRLKCATYPNR
ncbi:N-acetylmuramate/N-acetylglucosamine kinase [Roseobacter fucihabitans]|uniref:N-acetylmuramate/N-acetylglucosamine kinase n=1 Tax=Roseobacter fucihabitans TaxID=1537242 RepID=A0ABZ2C3C4_9RHOB|nr:phosphotransferase [Roseobacter litoralis]MBC6963889.1 Phosphotransferase enzyme family protein [Roseobacter litoralis]MBC6964026.1 Phosphotransferase enzyme family protein [Roseobacter litoralis]